MADYLDSDLAIAEVDPITKKIKATAYFEDYLYKIISTIGGEGSTAISDIINTVIAADKLDYMFSLIKSLKTQMDEVINNADRPVLDATVKQILYDTAGFIGKVKISAYTAENKDWVEARNKAVISLPANPLVNDQVIISNGDGSIINVNGNGNNIKYTSTDTSVNIRNQGTSLHFQLFEDQDTKYWRIR